MKYRFVLSAAFLALAGSAFASGSVSQPQRPPQPMSSTTGTDTDEYARGKQAYMDKLACSSCPVAGGVEDKDSAMALVARIDANEFQLKKGEKRRIKAYLNNRFKFK